MIVTKRETRRQRGRAPTVVRGEGAYFSDAGRALGQWAGGKLGGMVDSVTGLGAYNVHQNSLIADGSIQTSPSGPPRVVNTAKGEATVFHHREFVSDIMSGDFVAGTTSTDFNLAKYQLNPGNSALFPWLSKMAEGFQEYEVHGMLMQLITETADFSANFAIGNMMMAADYNPIAVAPNTKIELLEMEYSASVKTSSDLVMPIECDRANNGQNHLWVALDNDYQGTDARSFDLASVFVATQGQPAAQTKLAELWNTYEIWFYKPKLPDAPGDGSGVHYQLITAGNASPFGMTRYLAPGSSTNFECTSTLLTFPEGNNNWLVFLRWTGDSAVSFTPVDFTLTNCTQKLMFSSSLGNDLSNQGNAPQLSVLSKACVCAFYITTTGQATMQWFTGNIPTGFGDLYVLQAPDAIIA